LFHRDPATTAARLCAGASLSAIALDFQGLTGAASGYSSHSHVLSRPADVPGQSNAAFAATDRAESALALNTSLSDAQFIPMRA
jgi:hypothetical protein